jgi:hypothetical protein
MIANLNSKGRRTSRPDRTRAILREFFANALVLAALKAGEPVPQPVRRR